MAITMPKNELLEYAGYLQLASLFPAGWNAFRNAEPQMFQRMFGGMDESELDPFRRFTQQYTPFSYLASNPYGRPGGPSAAEQDVMNRSYFGSVAPLNLAGPQQANAALGGFGQSFLPGGGPQQFGVTPSGPLPYDPMSASGLSYRPGVGWQPVAAGGQPELVYYGPNQQSYYQGREITPTQASQLLASSPAAQGAQGLYGRLTSDIFGSVGGQLPIPQMPGAPTLPNAPSLPAFQMPSAPGLPAFQAPNVGGLAYSTYNQFAGGQPGFQQAMQSALNPQVAMPGQSIFQQVAAQSGAGGPMDRYVQAATQGTQAAADRALAAQVLAMQSRFAGEGSYMSGPMLNAQAELTAGSQANTNALIGQMQLQAAEAERGRQYGAATTQYTSELQRNLAQLQTQAQTAGQLAAVYGQIAASTSNAQAEALSRAYATQADYLGRTYAAQVGAAASAYGTQAGYLGNVYGTQVGGLTNIFGTQAGMYGQQLNAAMGQQQMAVQQATARAGQLQQLYGMSFDQAMRMAEAEQRNQQAALDALRNQYYQPGQNLIAGLGPVMGLPGGTPVVTGGGGFDFGGLIGGIAGGAGSWFT